VHNLSSFLSIFARPQAYLDPGTGSIITQVVVAGLLGAGIFLRAFWKKIFKKKSKPTEEAGQNLDSSQPQRPDEQ
jgi:hypothetical protein